MANKKGFNKYEIRGDTTIIFLENRKGEKFETMIDTEDLDRLIKLNYHWHVEHARSGLKPYYARTQVYQGCVDGVHKNNKTYKLHGLIMNKKPRELVDHRSRDTLDNRKKNLRIASKDDNSKNRDCSNKNNTSGYRNVSKVGNWWFVQLQVEGKNTLLKKFPLGQLDEAGAYAEKMRKKYYGDFAGRNQTIS